MSKHITDHLTCPYCHIQDDYDAWDFIDTGDNPELRAQVRSGEIFRFVCSHCDSAFDLNYPFIYHEPSTRLLFFYANNQNDYGRWLRILNKEEPSYDETVDDILSREGYTVRLVFGRDELYEKLSAFDWGLDDCIIEIAKIFYGQQLAKNQSEDLFDNIRFFHDDNEGGNMLYLMKDGQRVGKVKPDRNLYDNIAARYGERINRHSAGTSVINFRWALDVLQEKEDSAEAPAE